jgi:hypothetical protein
VPYQRHVELQIQHTSDHSWKTTVEAKNAEYITQQLQKVVPHEHSVTWICICLLKYSSIRNAKVFALFFSFSPKKQGGLMP